MKYILKTNGNNKIDDDFCEWLLEIIRHRITEKIDDKRLQIFDNYINEETNHIKLSTSKKLYSKNIVISGAKNLKVTKFSDSYIFYIDPNVKIPGIRLSLEKACALINGGNLNLPPYPIFTSQLLFVGSNIDLYLKMYQALKNYKKDGVK